MKKIISLLGCCFIAISTLTACENNNLPAWADTDVLTPKAQTMIDTLNAFDYDGVAEIYNNPAVDASTFEASGEIIETYGTFESYGNVSYGQYILGKPANGMSNRAIYQPATP